MEELTEMEWFAIHTRPRHEKSATRLLDLKGLESFLPLHRSRQRWSDRAKDVDLPLFPGYIFCKFEIGARVPVLETPGVVKIVRFGSEYVPVDLQEVEALQQLMRSGLPSEPWPQIEVGEPVVVAHGPLAGCQGILIDARKQVRLQLSVTILGRSVAVEVDRDWVGPAPSGEWQQSAPTSFPIPLNKVGYGRSAHC